MDKLPKNASDVGSFLEMVNLTSHEMMIENIFHLQRSHIKFPFSFTLTCSGLKKSDKKTTLLGNWLTTHGRTSKTSLGNIYLNYIFTCVAWKSETVECFTRKWGLFEKS